MGKPFIDESGRTWKTYDCTYKHDGATWSFEIMAPDLADAKSRVAKLGTAVLDGEVVAVIPWDSSVLASLAAVSADQH
jgi:hypothetical protein